MLLTILYLNVLFRRYIVLYSISVRTYNKNKEFTVVAHAEKAQTAKGFDMFAAIAAVDLTVPPNEPYKPVAEGEEVLGVLSENLRRLERVCSSLHAEQCESVENLRKLVLAHVEEHRTGKAHDCDAFQKKALLLQQELEESKSVYEMVVRIFHDLVFLEFGIPNSQDPVGIREGAQVVRYPKSETEQPPLIGLVMVGQI